MEISFSHERERIKAKGCATRNTHIVALGHMAAAHLERTCAREAQVSDIVAAMAICWTDNHQEMRGNVGQSLMHSATCDFYGKCENREYLISTQDGGEIAGLMIRVTGHEFTLPAFVSVDAAKAYAQALEDNRPARVAEGYYYAGKQPSVDLSTQRGFGDLWADEYSLRGIAISGAWADYRDA